VQLNEIPSVASIEDEKKYFDDLIRVFKNGVLIYLSSVPNFEINIKAAYTRSITVQTSRFDSTHETTWKALNKHKKSNIVINVERVYMLLWKKTEDSVFNSESNDAKVPQLQIAARANWVKLIKRRSAAISSKLNHVCMRHVYKFACPKCDVGQKCGCESSLMRIGSI